MSMTETEGSPLTWPSASDIPSETETTEPEVTETTETETETAPAETETTETAPPAETTEVAPPVETEPETFDRAYVENLRAENAKTRVRSKEFHDTFEGWEDHATEKFLDLARALNDESRHEEVGREFITIGKNILEAYGVEVGDLSAPDPNRPLTVRELEAREAKQREEADMAAHVEQIAKEVKELGYEEGGPDHYALLRLANDDPNGDLKVAHTKLEAWKKGIIDSFIKAHTAKQETHLPTAPAVGVAPSDPGEEPATDWAAARARLEANLQAQGFDQ